MPSTLPQLLDAAWSRTGDTPLCVGFSGGRDSVALLHALAAVRRAGRALRAVHVNHALHPESDRWAASCAQQCARLDVPLETFIVQVQARGEGIEAAAREARYAALAETLREGECLVTAHHREDQAETVLLKLLRGAGPHGLGGMREQRPLGRGLLWRPLLSTPREQLHAYARAQGLTGINDPANDDTRYARSYLRNDILPRLHAHWPEAGRALALAAALQREQADFLDHHATEALAELQRTEDGTLDAHGWVALHPALRNCVLESWLHTRSLPAPTGAQRHELERQIREAAPDRVPRVAWPGAEVRVWRGRLHALQPQPEAPEGWSALWHGDTVRLPDASTLHWRGSLADTPSAPTIRVSVNRRGLRIKPLGDRHTRALRDLFQRAGVPPWERTRCPILHDEHGTLLAVADLWSTEAGAALFRKHGMWPHWQR
ncbi:tRNA lysidine(34) synthetase TilS [Oleiagrimonas citrea]|uniref:tRNA(Ile)-lysidine synthase n=1 Tax=Oleiagrimonas citrea TaxID=1665687 RepID=A0A846ZH00_9GAMM|nr:tRNA lysidine(34) synthetase TilS [Oleiagrimonas citrea]NKZ37945.1 tRNA lysidine(34) synthetase TilS [Oleiagrimonas citrea]